MYTLIKDGDGFEQHYWTQFLSLQFPTYEKYWSKKIVPLTNRPKDIHFRKSADLIAAGYTPEDVCNAQLHYTTLRHLVRAFEILKHLKSDIQTILDVDLLGEGFVHLCSAQDVAFEFLQRNKTPNVYDPWAPNKKNSHAGIYGSKKARDKWQTDNRKPLQDIRNYRNHLTHGRLLPVVLEPGKVKAPQISKENNYLDWRTITDGYSLSTPMTDFDTLEKIMKEAWDKTIAYLEAEWKKL
jgi:hypothetical protein